MKQPEPVAEPGLLDLSIPIDAGTSTRGRTLPNRYMVVALLALMYMMSYIDRQVLSILAEPIKAELGLSDTQLGLLGGFAFAFFYTVFSIPIAWLADRANRVRILALCCMAWSIFTTVCGLAAGFWQLALARMAVGIGEAGGAAPSYSLIADYFPPAERGKGLALFSLGAPAGAMVGAAAAGWIAHAAGWRAAFIALSLPGIVVAALIAWLVVEPRTGRPAAAAVAGPVGGRGVLQRFRDSPALIGLTLASGFAAFVGVAMVSWLPAYLMRMKGASLSDIGSYYSLVSGFSIAASMLLGGWLVDAVGRRSPRAGALVPAAGFVIGLPFFLLALHVEDWRLSLAILTVPLVLSSSLYLSPALVFVQSSVGSEQRALAAALFMCVVNLLGLGTGPVFVGVVSDLAQASGASRPLQTGMLALSPAFLLAAGGFLLTARLIKINPGPDGG